MPLPAAPRTVGAITVLGILLSLPTPARSQADFYRGKTLQINIGFGPGGGYDLWARTLARHLGVPVRVIDKPPSADLEANQTDEGDMGVTYLTADRILAQILGGYRNEQIVAAGFDPGDVELVRRRVEGTHWKRHLPTTALVAGTAINEFYLRPVDF